jgi:hypothetical protein
MKLLIRKQIILSGLLAFLCALVPGQDGTVPPLVMDGVSIPSNFPHFTITNVNETAPGNIFITNRAGAPYLLIYKNDGAPYFYQLLKDYSLDFKLHENGMLSHWIEEDVRGYRIINEHFEIVDTFLCQNDYDTDEHEFQLLSNGHALMIAKEERSMSQIDPDRNPDITVIGNHIQEIDENHNLVFQWDCWDHFDLEDSYIENLDASLIDYVHMNSIAVDTDGHLVISSRHLSECTKINRQTGEIMWRLGGKNNEFNFINDRLQISYQHDFRPVPGKADHYTLFDNGNQREIKFSRVIELKLDTINMIAEKVWEYRPIPHLYSRLMGNAQRLPNGNTLINWGDPAQPKISEVTADSILVYEADFLPKMNNYRTFRFEFEGYMLVPYLIAEPYPDRVRLLFNKFGDQGVEYYHIYGGEDPEQMEWVDSTSASWIDLMDLMEPGSSGYYYFEVTAVDSSGTESGPSGREKVYVRNSTPGDNLIINGDFSEGESFWTHQNQGEGSSSGSVSDSVYRVHIENPGNASSDVLLFQDDIPLILGKEYVLELDARAEFSRALTVDLVRAGTNQTNYSRHGQAYITDQFTHIEHTFVMEKPNDLKSRLLIKAGEYDSDFEIKNVSLRQLVVSGTPQLERSANQLDCYPNPVSKTLHIKFQLDSNAHIKLELFNLQGQLIESLYRGNQIPGHHEITFDTEKLATGAYILQLRDGIQSYSSIVLVRH